jgi:hypothetical protein
VSNRYKHLILLFVACVIALATWIIVDKKIIPGEYEKLIWFVIPPVSAARVSASLPRMFGLSKGITKVFMGIVAVLGWYCPLVLIFMRKIPISKRHKVFCIVMFIIIWILPFVGYLAAMSE